VADSWTSDQIGVVRASGEAADGLVRVEVDGAGQVIDLVLDPRAMRLGAPDLAEAVKAALAQAQAAARSEVDRQVRRLGETLPSRDRLAATLEEATASAERRMNEFSTAVYDLSRRAGSQ
jgi:DNA-binding protein YbaB